MTSETMPAPPAPPVREERPFFAIGLRLAAMFSISIMFALVKLLDTRGVHLAESLFYRQALALPFVFGWIMFAEGAGAIRTRRIGTHFSRMALGLIGMALNFSSYILLPLTEATTIGFTMPIFGTILSALLLREMTGIHRWSAVILGFVGVLIMVRPDAGHFPLMGVAVALSAAIVTAVIAILLRELGRTEGAAVTVFWFTLLSMPPLSIGMLFFAQPHDGVTWMLLALMGMFGGISQLFLTGALRWAPVSVVLPMDYSAILWATAFGWLIWNQWPLPTTFMGGALIIASGLYIAWREHVRTKRIREAADVSSV
ncbi:MAG: DMT family transporter [Sphingobium phenoxybenzoativorans]|uniref:DMT family transporter n=1 Tax=Sphingobium phenoxybenzoativorans TaxID=1592790 RepID=UPI000AA1F369|nr:DMT family transporter [Sphingobium phenoxybenzoativorans]